ncbi:peroxisomal membrane protein 13 [Iris pallida]|uniref:Peroxisomal membrane protein 13 n=1 Tax=Iris pallida TaxID=29817 RepID=A0AAX6DZI3_IRIPA|nr:peroxisomal membrane protein 13 [Iris pallida]
MPSNFVACSLVNYISVARNLSEGLMGVTEPISRQESIGRLDGCYNTNKVIVHHQNLGSGLGPHLVLHLSSPHLLATLVKLLKPLELQNLEKSSQMIMHLQTDKTLLGGLSHQDHGSGTMETVMEVTVQI